MLIQLLSHWSGADGEAVYNILSGLLPDLLALGFVGGWWRRHNCHERGCFRINWHGVEHPEHEHPVCKVHHPEHQAQPFFRKRHR